MKPSLTLRRYLSLQFALIVALPLFIFAALAGLFFMPQMRAHIGMQHQAIARAIAGHISGHLMGGQRQLAAMADYVERLGFDSSSHLTTLLDAQCGDGELFETIYILENGNDTIGTVGLSSDRRANRVDLIGLDISGRGFLSKARSTRQAFWSETFLSTASGRLAVALAIPVADSIMIGEIALGRLSEYLSLLPSGAGLITIVLDGHGRIVADSQMQLRGQQFDLSTLPPSRTGTISDGQDDGASTRFELHGRQLVGTVVDIEALGWNVLIAQPQEQAYAPLRSVMQMIAIGLAIALFLALLVAWLRAGNLSLLFRQYAELSQSIARGQYDLKWPPSRTAEFQNLADNLDAMARTISERESQLVTSETHLRITLDSIGDAVIATDVQGMITRINPMAARLTGWPVAEAVGRPLTEVFHIINAITHAAVPSPVERVLAEGEIVGLANHTLLIARDGHRYQIADSGAPIRYPDGSMIGVVLVFRDVTESYSQEQKIRQNEKLLKDITANVPGVVYQFRSTRDHVYENVFVSVKAAEIFALDADPKTFHEKFHTRIPPEERTRFITSIQEAVDKVEPWHYEGRFLKPDGEEIWFSAHATPHETGDEIVFYGVLMDITERKRLEASLRLTQFCVDQASIGIFRIGEGGMILDVNQEACRSLEYSREELCRLTVFDIDPNFNPRIWPGHIEGLRKLRTRSIETLHRTKSGRVFPVHIVINLMDFEGQEYHVAYVQDISERKSAEAEAKRLEAALLQAQKMEAIGTLAGGIAHDFNNILAAVIGFAELSLWKMAPDEPVYANLQKILTAGLRARDLVDQILTFSRRDERQLQPLQVGPLVKEALKLLRSSLPTTIVISHDIGDPLGNVMADATQIHRVIMNLCTNAAHAMESEGGRLHVSLTHARLSEQDVRLHPGLQPGEYLKLSVQDSGCGIPGEVITRIYDPYFTTKPKGKGTGLGLSVVHGIVQACGGAINAHSEPGTGTTFHIYLPVIKGQFPLPQKTRQSLPRGHEHILLVDDETALVDLWRQVLTQLGYRVSTASDGQEALRIFSESSEPIDLVVTDMTMPRMTGERLAVELLKIKPDLPIILCTGYSAGMSAEKALKLGIRAFVQKPVVEAELAGVIRKVMQEACPRH